MIDKFEYFKKLFSLEMEKNRLYEFLNFASQGRLSSIIRLRNRA